MEYGNKSIKPEKLYLYQGFDPATENLPPNKLPLDVKMGVVNQRDADLLFLWKKVIKPFLIILSFKIWSKMCVLIEDMYQPRFSSWLLLV